MKKPNAIILLEFLLEGGEYTETTKNGVFTWVIEDDVFGLLGEREIKGKMEEVILPYDMTVEQFLHMARDMKEEDILNISLNKTIKHINKKDRDNVCNKK